MQDPEVDIEVKMEDHLDIMSGVNEKDDSLQISITKCNDEGLVTSSGADCKQGLTANKQVKKYDSPQISTTKYNDEGLETSSGANCKQGLTANKQVKKYDSLQISTTKFNNNADTEDECKGTSWGDA